MADFAEMFHAKQIDADSYSFYWEQVDLATEDHEVSDFDYSQDCSAEALRATLATHGFDAGKVFAHFKNHPCSGITLTDEY